MSRKLKWVAFFFVILIVTVLTLNILNSWQRLAIIPFDKFPDELKEAIVEGLEQTYGVEVLCLPEEQLPETAYYPPRNRFRADSLISYLKHICPDEYDHVLGLTSSDISTTKGEYPDWGVFGLGYCPGKSGIASTFRLKNQGSEKLKERVVKVAIHEIGHNYGLRHCTNDSKCVMNDACGSLKEVDENEHRLCSSCRLKWLFYKATSLSN